MKIKKSKLKYEVEQHRMICDELGVSSDPDAPGDTALEAVCALLAAMKTARGGLSEALRRKPVSEECSPR